MQNIPKISLIAALSSADRAIGKENKLLWKIPEDMRRFKSLTTGHVVIMGRKTFESIGKPLPNRTNIVLTRSESFAPAGTIACRSLDEALTAARKIEQEEIFVIGGAEIYKEAMPIADKLYLTIVQSSAPGDAFFPDYSSFQSITARKAGAMGEIEYAFMDLER